MSEQCLEQVFSGLSRWSRHPCGRNAVIIEDGKPVCRYHTVAAKAEREIKREERIRAVWQRRKRGTSVPS